MINKEEECEQDLMSFEDLETDDESSQQTPTKHVVVAKCIVTPTIQEVNSLETSVDQTRSKRTKHDKTFYDLGSQSPQY